MDDADFASEIEEAERQSALSRHLARSEAEALAEARGDSSIPQYLGLGRRLAATGIVCEICAEPIPAGRLSILPNTRLCIDCAIELERLRER